MWLILTIAATATAVKRTKVKEKKLFCAINYKIGAT